MKGIIGTRGIGKTKKLAFLAAETNATIVAADPDKMYEKIHAYNLTGLRCISYAEYIEEAKTSPDVKYVVDDVEKLLESISKNTISYTISLD